MPKAALEYAARGLVGLLVPPANPTVEPEASILWPAGISHVAMRLMGSASSRMEDRLEDYLKALDEALIQINNTPVDCFTLAVTGASYFIGAVREDAMVAEREAERGVPFVTAARAVRDALNALGAKRLGLVSPYPDEVTRASQAYWESRGFSVTRIVKVPLRSAAYHPIYELGTAEALATLRSLDPAGVDAVVMLGTGMPTLGAILAQPAVGGAPVISSMLAVAWRTAEAMADRAASPSGATLRHWIAAEHWGQRLAHG